jgi:hypothetical protein
MKLNKVDREKAIRIIESFREKKGPVINSKGNIVAKPYIIEYIKQKLDKNYKPLASYNIGGIIYSIERINTYLYMSREAEGIDTKKVMLNSSDLDLIKSTNSITRTELEALVKKVDWEEMRFGL